MLQASITRGLNAEMDAYLGYESGDRGAKAAAGEDNHRNGSYPKTVDFNYGQLPLMSRGIGLEHSCRLWSLKVLGA